MSIIVHKYGGTSVGSPERINAVADRLLLFRKQCSKIVVVVSAMGDTTDELVSLAQQMSSSPSPREYDALVSNGENISAALLAMALQERDVPAVSLTGAQAGVKTSGPYSRSKIHSVDTSRILRELSSGCVVIVTGFQGVNDASDVTTIGRGGSDTSAVVLASSLGAKECDICTDVDGIYTTDPRSVHTAKKLRDVSYDEMLDLASLGAKVLHPRAVEVAKENNVVLHVRSSFNMTEGTWVKEAKRMEVNRPVTGVTVNKDEAQVTIYSVPDEPGVAGMLFSRLAEKSINVDMIIQSAERDGFNKITFTVGRNDVAEAKQVTMAMATEVGAGNVRCDEHVAKLSIVGVGMVSKPGVAALFFNTLGSEGINIRMISTSEIKVSCVIDERMADRALQCVHDAFGLDSV